MKIEVETDEGCFEVDGVSSWSLDGGYLVVRGFVEDEDAPIVVALFRDWLNVRVI